MEQDRQWLVEMGARLRNERERQGLSRAALAKTARTDSGYLVQLEKGMKAPSLNLFRNLLRALNTSADYIIFGITGGGGRDFGGVNGFVGFLNKQDKEDIEPLINIVKSIVLYKDSAIKK